MMSLDSIMTSETENTEGFDSSSSLLSMGRKQEYNHDNSVPLDQIAQSDMIKSTSSPGSNVFSPHNNHQKSYQNDSERSEAALDSYSITTKKYSCSQCNYSSNVQCHVESHIRTHSGEKPFICEICQKSFTQKSTLNLHRIIHTGRKPYGCNVCEFHCNNKGNLKKHMMKHTGEKPYCCEVCCKAFTQKSSLNLHKTIHTGEKPFTCEICCKKFTQRSSLNLHKIIHTGLKPYGCKLCEFHCNNKGNLKKHMMKHTGERPFNCHVCSKTFAQKSSLKTHMTVHSGKSNKSISQNDHHNTHFEHSQHNDISNQEEYNNHNSQHICNDVTDIKTTLRDEMVKHSSNIMQDNIALPGNLPLETNNQTLIRNNIIICNEQINQNEMRLFNYSLPQHKTLPIESSISNNHPIIVRNNEHSVILRNGNQSELSVRSNLSPSHSNTYQIPTSISSPQESIQVDRTYTDRHATADTSERFLSQTLPIKHEIPFETNCYSNKYSSESW